MKIEEIEKMEEILKKEREKIVKEEAKVYADSVHSEFKVGDWVTDGKDIGKVQLVWEDKPGYINVSLKTGNRGCLCLTRANKYELVCDDALRYYQGERMLSFRLTGEHIDDLLYAIPKNVNPSNAKDKLIKALNDLREDKQ